MKIIPSSAETYESHISLIVNLLKDISDSIKNMVPISEVISSINQSEINEYDALKVIYKNIFDVLCKKLISNNCILINIKCEIVLLATNDENIFYLTNSNSKIINKDAGIPIIQSKHTCIFSQKLLRELTKIQNELVKNNYPLEGINFLRLFINEINGEIEKYLHNETDMLEKINLRAQIKLPIITDIRSPEFLLEEEYKSSELFQEILESKKVSMEDRLGLLNDWEILLKHIPTVSARPHFFLNLHANFIKKLKIILNNVNTPNSIWINIYSYFSHTFNVRMDYSNLLDIAAIIFGLNSLISPNINTPAYKLRLLLDKNLLTKLPNYSEENILGIIERTGVRHSMSLALFCEKILNFNAKTKNKLDLLFANLSNNKHKEKWGLKIACNFLEQMVFQDQLDSEENKELRKRSARSAEVSPIVKASNIEACDQTSIPVGILPLPSISIDLTSSFFKSSINKITLKKSDRNFYQYKLVKALGVFAIGIATGFFASTIGLPLVFTMLVTGILTYFAGLLAIYSETASSNPLKNLKGKLPTENNFPRSGRQKRTVEFFKDQTTSSTTSTVIPKEETIANLPSPK